MGELYVRQIIMKPFSPWFIYNVLWAGLLRLIQLYYVSTTVTYSYTPEELETFDFRSVNTVIWMIVVISLLLLLLTVLFEMLLTKRASAMDSLSSTTVCLFSALVAIFGFLVVVNLQFLLL